MRAPCGSGNQTQCNGHPVKPGVEFNAPLFDVTCLPSYFHPVSSPKYSSLPASVLNYTILPSGLHVGPAARPSDVIGLALSNAAMGATQTSNDHSNCTVATTRESAVTLRLV